MPTSQKLKGRLDETLKELHLPTVRECYEEEAGRARAESLSHEQYLLEIVERECEVRGQGRIERNLRTSRLPLEKSLQPTSTVFRTNAGKLSTLYRLGSHDTANNMSPFSDHLPGQAGHCQHDLPSLRLMARGTPASGHTIRPPLCYSRR